MLREEESQWEQGFSKPQYHTRWNSMLGEVHSSPTDSAGSLHAEYMNLPDAEEDQWAFFRSVCCQGGCCISPALQAEAQYVLCG